MHLIYGTIIQDVGQHEFIIIIVCNGTIFIASSKIFPDFHLIVLRFVLNFMILLDGQHGNVNVFQRSMSSSNSDSIQVPSTSSGHRHRRSSFWDIFSPARSHNVRSKRKSAGNGRRSWAIPAIRINSVEIGSTSAAFTGSLINLTGLDDNHEEAGLEDGTVGPADTSPLYERRRKLRRLYSFDDSVSVRSCQVDYYTSPEILEERQARESSGNTDFMLKSENTVSSSAQHTVDSSEIQNDGSGYKTDESSACMDEQSDLQQTPATENLTVPWDSTEKSNTEPGSESQPTQGSTDIPPPLAHSRAKFIAKNRPRLLSHPVISTGSFMEIQTAPLRSDDIKVNPLDEELSGGRRASLAHGTSPIRLFFMPSYLMRRASQISTVCQIKWSHVL